MPRKWIRLSKRNPHARAVLTTGVVVSVALSVLGAEWGLSHVALIGTSVSTLVNVVWIWEDF